MNNRMQYGYRSAPQRGRGLPCACGCLVGMLGTAAALIAIALIFLLPNLQPLAMQALGATSLGSTISAFPSPAAAPPALQNSFRPAQFTLSASSTAPQTLTNDSALWGLMTGADASGSQTASATVSERGLLELCNQRTTICSPNSSDPRVRNARIDLRPSGAIIAADVTLPELGGLPIGVGLALAVGEDGRSLRVIGIDMQGMLYSIPPAVSDLVATAEQRVNDWLNTLSLQTPDGIYRLSQIYVTDDALTVLFRP